MVETGGLENRFALTGNGGSNPSPSANRVFECCAYARKPDGRCRICGRKREFKPKSGSGESGKIPAVCL